MLPVGKLDIANKCCRPQGHSGKENLSEDKVRQLQDSIIAPGDEGRGGEGRGLISGLTIIWHKEY